MTTPGNLDPRGPIPTYQVKVGRQSVQVEKAPKPTNPNDEGPGVGQWIWLPGPVSTLPARFRKTMTLSTAPKAVKAWITADVRYRMWVNGRLAARGPADVGRDYDMGPPGPWFEDVRDLSRFFHKDVNVVAIEVFATPFEYGEGTTGHPGLKLDLTIREGGNSVSIGTDDTWRTTPATDFDQAGAKDGYRLDMTREPANWQAIGFDDAGWTNAVISEAAKRPTIISELPQATEASIHPVGITRVSEGVIANPMTGGATFAKDGGYAVQYGHVLAGYIGLKVNGHKGVRLLIEPNEHDAPGFHRHAEVLLRDGEQVLELPFFDSFSVVNIKAEGVRQPFTIEDVSCVFTSYPVHYAGEFSCDRSDYNRVWEVCRWATQICMQTHELDSPHHQEPIADPGDYLIESLVSFYAFGDGALARQDLKKFARLLQQRHFQTFHTSYTLLWLQMLVQYYDCNGDAETVRELAPVVLGLLDRFEGYIGPNGLISEAPNYMFEDWVEIEGFNLHHPPAVIGQGYMTALYYQALADGGRVARLIHDAKRADHCTALRKQLAAAFERELWDPTKELYRDGKPFQTAVKPNDWLPADKAIETFSTQGNALAVACGLATGDRARSVMETVLARKDMNCQPYFMHFVFEAMAAAGLFNQDARAQLDRWHIVPDTQTFHEMWDSGDLSHAWIATPLIQMSSRILGVRPLKPGFATFLIDPNPCDLKWANGKVPTPHGTISVAWTRDGDHLDVHFTVPRGTVANIGGKEYGPGSHLATLKF